MARLDAAINPGQKREVKRMDKKELENVNELDFEKMALNELEEIEEVVTPFDGSVMCC